MFKLHSQLAKDCLPVTDLGLCRVFLQNNSNFPWLVLVPMRENLREIFDLVDGDYESMMNEVRSVAKHLSIFTRAHKINVAALGNMVPQLHIHVIARFENDLAWPNPVWNSGVSAMPYAPEKAELLIKELRAIF